jgi:integrase/recombinase XerC
MSPGSPGRPARHFADSRREGGATYESLRKDAQTRGFRLSRRGQTYRIILDTGNQIVHTGSFGTAAAFLAGQPKPDPHWRRKPVPRDWAQPIDDYLLTLAAAGYRATTLETRRANLNTMARGLGCAPDAVTGELLVGWFGTQHWEPETRKGYRSAARGFFTWAYRTGRAPAYISDDLPKPRPPHAVPRPVPDDALAAALAVADARTTLMLRLAAQAGLRRAEVSQVHTRDLVETVDGAQLLVHGKGGKERVVPISAGLAVLIRRGAVGHTPELGALGFGADGWLFPEGGSGYVRGGGRHISPEWVGTVVSRALPTGYSMHKLRHAYASRVFRGSRNLRAVQTLLGHASIATTERYVAVDSDEIRAAAACAW